MSLRHETERLETRRIFNGGSAIARNDVFQHRRRVAEVAREDFAEHAAEIGAFSEITSAAAAENIARCPGCLLYTSPSPRDS